MDKEMSRTIIVVVAILAVTYLLVQFRGGFGGEMGTGEQPSAPTIQPTQPTRPTQQARITDIGADDDPSRGDKSAPVTMIEFSDFQCPFCGRFWSQTLPQIEQEYIKTGKVKFVYRDFPLDAIHPNARPAAEAAECADEQGKFWEFHDKIFQNQQQLSVENYKKWAAELGLNAEKFNGCVDSKKYAEEVSKDLADATAAGGTGTPYFLINGKPLTGAQPFAAFKAAIDAELAGK
ncbi:DsbA family protein [Candidatus Woesearchaeota archaeon]|nr:DsbA family protein [Candidatus Woesearchaeota archaeon]